MNVHNYQKTVAKRVRVDDSVVQNGMHFEMRIRTEEKALWLHG